jgi:Xaa-Pro dipeptidase
MAPEVEREARMTPAWTYRPGPDVSPSPPPELVSVQRIAITAAEQSCAAARARSSERELESVAAQVMRDCGAVGVWTPTNVGAGVGSRDCFPTVLPSDRALEAADVGFVDVHPIAVSGAWGDCTRTVVVGDDPEAAAAMEALERIHAATLANCRPGMPASELFGPCRDELSAAGFELLDRLGNIGHSLGSGVAYIDGFIDAGNETPMWGAWAIEPFAGLGTRGFKLEDVVWFGREACTVVGHA